MKQNQVKLVGVGLLLTLVLLAYSGCSGGGGGGGGSSSNLSISTSSIKGTTSGLLGTGLVLQNNGTDDLEITANGHFNFPTRVEDGTNCNVTILSQPTSPAQTCVVGNGSDRLVSGSDITDVQVRCLTTINETFDSGGLNSGYWNSSGEYDRKMVNGELQFNLMASGEFANDSIAFLNNDCGKISADVTITNTVFTGTGANSFRTRLQGCGYHTATEGEELGSRTGDINAEINVSGDQAYFRVFRCLSDQCSSADSVEYLSPGGVAGILLGATPLYSPATLMIDWDSALSPGQFTFQLNNDPPVNFDPVAAGAPISAAAPNKPGKRIGVSIGLYDPNDKAEMTVTVDNVIDGLMSDNFDSGKYLDGSFWKETDKKRRIENGRLVLETGQEFEDDPIADTRFNYTSLVSNDELSFSAEVVEADITLDPAAFVRDFGGRPAEVYARLLMEFRPPNSDKKDSTNSFVIQAALKEDPSGVAAVMLAQGCANYSCTSTHTIANDEQSFTAPVAKGNAYHVKIEHLGNGVFDITLDHQETLTVDLSTIPGFSLTELSAITLKTSSRATDTQGEEAFIRAFFDNVRMGNP